MEWFSATLLDSKRDTYLSDVKTMLNEYVPLLSGLLSWLHA